MNNPKDKTALLKTELAFERATIATLRADVVRWTIAATEARLALESIKAKAESERLSLQEHADALAHSLGAIRSRDLWACGLGDSTAEERESRMVQIADQACKRHNARAAAALEALLSGGSK